VLGVGDQIPDATVFATSREPVPLRQLVSERASLLVFYLFDFSAT
jgi:peroxiredoxin